MKFKPIDPPRRFTVGRDTKFEVKDCAHIELKPNEQVTFITESGGEYDLARKEWGFYASPSLNGRLKSFGLRAALVKNDGSKKFYVMLVEKGKEGEFQAYLKTHDYWIVSWMDSDEELNRMAQKLAAPAKEVSK